jgi:hypothetical protein
LPYIKHVPTFTTDIMFTKRYCNNELLNYIKVDRALGIAMVKGLYTLYDNTLSDGSESDEIKEDADELENKSSESDEIKEDADELEHKSSESFSENEEDIDNKNGCIPIMIVPCKKFRIPYVKNYSSGKDVKKIVDYIKNHYLKCSNCEVINNNNNNKEPFKFFDDAEFD